MNKGFFEMGSVSEMASRTAKKSWEEWRKSLHWDKVFSHVHLNSTVQYSVVQCSTVQYTTCRAWAAHCMPRSDTWAERDAMFPRRTTVVEEADIIISMRREIYSSSPSRGRCWSLILSLPLMPAILPPHLIHHAQEDRPSNNWGVEATLLRLLSR